jgi:hypothetical protein
MSFKNPFQTPHGADVSGDDRLHAIKGFNLDECHAALNVTGLQKSVENALKRKIKKLNKGF